jgi:4-amino-4-deoxy-L-arabinose transferase-like glycosyltransferase
MKKYLPLVILIAILSLATFLRLYQLDTAPPGVWYDEAYNGLDALKAMEHSDYKIFYPENYGREGLYINALAVSFKLFGVNSFALRFPSALFGILTVLGFYFLLRKLKLTKTTTMLGVFVLATSFYHLNFSRIAFRAIMVPFLLTWSFYFFIKGFYIIKEHTTNQAGFLKKILNNALFNFFIAGALTGVGLHTYIAYRVVPLIFVIILFIFLLIYKRFLANYWKAILVFIVGAVITAGPILFYFQQNPAAFTGRTDAVSIFNAPDMTVPEAFIKSLSLHLQSFFFIGDGNQRHNHTSLPILPSVWALFFAIGFFISLKEIFSNLTKRFFSADKFEPTKLLIPAILGQAIFWPMLIPGVLSLEGIPHVLRIIGVIPAIFLLTVLPFEYLRRLYLHLKASPFYVMKHWRWLIMQTAFSVLVVTFILTGVFQVYTYFELWAKNQKTAESFQQDLYLLGLFIKKQPLKSNNYLLLGNHININKQDRSDFSEKSLLFSGYPTIKDYLAYNVNEDITGLVNGDAINCSDSQFILQQNIPLLSLKKIKNYCPNLELQEISLDNNTETSQKFWVLR